MLPGGPDGGQVAWKGGTPAACGGETEVGAVCAVGSTVPRPRPRTVLSHLGASHPAMGRRVEGVELPPKLNSMLIPWEIILKGF
jgi:hypothetical protein